MDPAREPLAGGDGLQRRPAAAARSAGGPQEQPPRGQRPPIHPDVDPPPRPWPGMQKLAIVAIVVLGCLQFLPATHFRDPHDPQRTWIPIDRSGNPADSLNYVGRVDVFSWMSCLDLRTLAVLTNSTLSSSRPLGPMKWSSPGPMHSGIAICKLLAMPCDPDNISFHFLIPEGGNDKLSYHKLKVLLPDSDLTVTSQKQIKDKLNVATPEGNFLWLFHMELSPFLIAKSQLSKKRYVYIAADSIIKGKVEDLGCMDLGGYAIGAVEDCSKRLNDYISMDVLSAIQRAGAAQSRVSKEPYNKDACLLVFDVLLIEPRKLEKNLLASIMWWANAINLANQRDQIRLAVTLAFNDKYMKLPSNWKRADNTDILHFDGPKNVCSEDGRQHEQSGYGTIWQQYLQQKSEAILNT